MYKIYIDDHLLHAESLTESEYRVLNPILSAELNRSYMLSFSVPYKHPNYNSIAIYKPTVTVYDGSQRVYRGRVIASDIDFFRNNRAVCESDIGFLNDVIMRPYEFAGSIEAYFKKCVHEYNIGADADRRFGTYSISGTATPATNLTTAQIQAAAISDFVPGVCTVTDPNNYIVRESVQYKTVYTEMMDKLVGLCGGYLMTRYANGIDYVDYLAESGVTDNTQTIKFAENLLDLGIGASTDNFYSVIVPIGAKQENDVPLTIASVNDGNDCLEDAEKIQMYGRIERVVEWEDVTIASNLKAKAQAALNASSMYNEITVTAVDLHGFDAAKNRFRVGNKYRVYSYPHGFKSASDNLFLLSKATISIDNPADSAYTFVRQYVMGAGDKISQMINRRA